VRRDRSRVDAYEDVARSGPGRVLVHERVRAARRVHADGLQPQGFWYLTEQPYGGVDDVVTGFPAFASSNAART
jgi:hypothetical protein